MTFLQDTALLGLVGGVLTLLVLASIMGWVLSRRVTSAAGRTTVENINARTRAWWVMALLFVVSVATGAIGSILLFSLISFLALREFVTLAPTRPGDHRALFWRFFVVTPLQYYLIWIEWYGLFSILIPVWASIFLGIRTLAAPQIDRRYRTLSRANGDQSVGADDRRLFRELRSGAAHASHPEV